MDTKYKRHIRNIGGAKSFASTLQGTQNKSRRKEQTNSCLFTRKEELLSNNTNKAISTFITKKGASKQKLVRKEGGRGLNLLSSSFRKNISSMSKMNLCGGGQKPLEISAPTLISSSQLVKEVTRYLVNEKASFSSKTLVTDCDVYTQPDFCVGGGRNTSLRSRREAAWSKTIQSCSSKGGEGLRRNPYALFGGEFLCK